MGRKTSSCFAGSALCSSRGANAGSTSDLGSLPRDYALIAIRTMPASTITADIALLATR
jgi:hypothetical protein